MKGQLSWAEAKKFSGGPEEGVPLPGGRLPNALYSSLVQALSRYFYREGTGAERVPGSPCPVPPRADPGVKWPA